MSRLSQTAHSAQRGRGDVDELVEIGLARSAVEHDRTVAEGDDPLALGDGGELVGRDHERRAIAVGGAEQLEQRIATGAVEPDERLVDHHHLERADERQADGCLLAQSAAERRRQLVGAIGQADGVQQLVGPLLPLRPAVQPGDVLEVLAHGEVVVEDRLVGEVARALPAPRSSPAGARPPTPNRPTVRASR